jgi:dGTPase
VIFLNSHHINQINFFHKSDISEQEDNIVYFCEKFPSMTKKFSAVATVEGSEKWEQSLHRETPMYKKTDDIRNEFSRDFNRILHCNAYRRLKHKTQVFYGTRNDHICTRIEHVQHVSAISSTIAQELGLNVDLVSAIALGHDLGHAPFGHEGEKILSGIAMAGAKPKFWHEQNSLIVADKIETLAGLDGKRRNLNLTYAVRDGLISHCGEVDENGLKPRDEAVDLYDIERPNQYAPYTWEACVVKIADKIAYLGRDIEDALRLKILDNQQLEELRDTLKLNFGPAIETVNTTNLVHGFILNLVEHSDSENGLLFSDEYFHLMNNIKKFNYKHIYKHKRLLYYNKYAKLILESLYEVLYEAHASLPGFSGLMRFYPQLAMSFRNWLVRYSDLNEEDKAQQDYEIPVVYRVGDEMEYSTAVLMYIALMTDYYAIDQYKQLIAF